MNGIAFNAQPQAPATKRCNHHAQLEYRLQPTPSAVVSAPWSAVTCHRFGLTRVCHTSNHPYYELALRGKRRQVAALQDSHPKEHHHAQD